MGRSGRIVVSADGGDTWEPAGGGLEIPMADMVEQFAEAPDGTVWAICSQGTAAAGRAGRVGLAGGAGRPRGQVAGLPRLMQFYLDGYRPGDPLVATASVRGGAAGGPPRRRRRPDRRVRPGRAGAGGAAGQFPDIRTAVVDRRDGPLQVGQADGVACRTVEMFEAFGLADRLVTRPTGSTRSLLAAGPG